LSSGIYLLSGCQKDYAQAEKYCLDIINSDEYSLLPRYGENFITVGENGVESSFEINAAAVQDTVGSLVAAP